MKKILAPLLLLVLATAFAQTAPTGALDIVGQSAFDGIRDTLLTILQYAAIAGLVLLGAVVGVSKAWKYIYKFFG